MNTLLRLSYGVPTVLFAWCQLLWLRTRRLKSASVRSLHFQLALAFRRVAGGLGSSVEGVLPVALGERNQYRVTMPKFPPPPPVWAHHSSRLGSAASRVATTQRAVPEAST